MTILRAITADTEEELCGHEVAIRDGKIALCPGCGANEVHTTENKEFGLTFVGHHVVSDTTTYCEFGGVTLKFLPENSLKEERTLQ